MIVERDEAIGVRVAEEIDRAFLDRQVVGNRAEEKLVRPEDSPVGPSGRLDPFLPPRSDHAVGRKPIKLVVARRVGAGGGEHGDLVRPREVRQPREILEDRLRAPNVERAGRFEKIALGVDVDEHERTIPHDSNPAPAVIVTTAPSRLVARSRAGSSSLPDSFTSTGSAQFVAADPAFRQTNTWAMSSSVTGPKATSTSNPARRRISGRSAPNSVKTG